MSDEAFQNRVANDRISHRQLDELIGLARGLCADRVINEAEVDFLRSWLAANLTVVDNPLISTLWQRIEQFLSDGHIDSDEQRELFETLNALGGEQVGLGEVLKPSSLPLCDPAPTVIFGGSQFTFTGTFLIGKRSDCERIVAALGGQAGTLTRQTRYLVIGEYVTEAWKHSAMGNKIIKAMEMRAAGVPISIISEAHWNTFLPAH